MSRTLAVHSPAIPTFLGQPTLEPVRLSGHEGVNSLFEYELILKTPDALNLNAIEAADFDLDSFIGREISCVIELDGAGQFIPGAVGASVHGIGAGTRQINALIAQAAMLRNEGRHVQYKLVLRPWLHLAQLSTDCKIFQNQSVVQTLDELLAAYPFPVDKRLMETYPLRDYQTQMNESDWEFFTRLTQENGISYFFEHSEGAHRLVLIDNMGAHKHNPSAAYQEVEYHPPGWKTDAEYIHGFEPHNRLTSSKYTTRDYDYTRPKAKLDVSHSDPRPTGQSDGEVYQWHDNVAGSHYAQPKAGAGPANDPHAEGREFALKRMQALRTHGARATASGNLRGMVPGCSFALRGHPRTQANAEYLVLDTEFLIEDVAQDSQIKDASLARKQQWQVKVDFTAHPMREPLRPALTQPKPRCGPQSALVVGPPEQNIWTDALGRIKVQFPWDRVGQKTQHSSCWIRMSSPWAGNQQGSMHVPRVGQEVLVNFMGGDPDLPICTGRLYNQDNLPPWKLPEQSALSGFRSRELTADGGNSAAGRSNHLILDDTEHKIQAQFKSDHLSSSLSLGHITRIEDNEGRKDARGEGMELRTDGHGVVRSAKGLLLSTDERAQAEGGMLARDELISELRRALQLAKDFVEATKKCEGIKRETQPQEDLSDAVAALGHGTGDEADKKGKASPGQPVLALSGAAGIASATPKSHTQYAGLNLDTIAGKNQQHYAGDSILQSANNNIEQLAIKGDIRAIANQGKVILQAQHNSFEITAEGPVTVKSTRDEYVCYAEKTITLVTGDGTYLRLGNGKAIIGTKGDFIVNSAKRRLQDPGVLSTDMPTFSTAQAAGGGSSAITSGFNEAFVLKEEITDKLLPNTKYRLVFRDGGVVEGVTDAGAIIPLKQTIGRDVMKVQLLGGKS